MVLKLHISHESEYSTPNANPDAKAIILGGSSMGVFSILFGYIGHHIENSTENLLVYAPNSHIPL